jgi:hypothetical protein
MLHFLLGLLFGAVLGLRFDVLILLPATLLAWGLTVVAGLATGAPLQAMVLDGVVVTIALQAGYLFGTLFRRALLSLQLRRQRAVPRMRAATERA